MKQHKRLGELLVGNGIINEFQLTSALNDQRQWGNRLGSSLIRLGFMTEESLTAFLSRQYGLPGVDLDKEAPHREALAMLSAKVARQRLVLPLAIRDGEGGKPYLEIAFGDPENLERIDEIRFATSHEVRIRLASDHAILRAINKYYFGMEEEEETDGPESLDLDPNDPDASKVLTRSPGDQLFAVEEPGAQLAESSQGAPAAPVEGDREDRTAAEALFYVRALTRILVRKGIVTREDLKDELRRK